VPAKSLYTAAFPAITLSNKIHVNMTATTPKISHYPKEYPVPRNPNAFFELPIEALAFAVAGAIASFFKLTAASALGGIGLGLFTAKLAAKAMNLYNPELLIGITKKACKLVKQYPRLQFISFIFTLMISIPFQNLGFSAGIIVGGFGAIILDVEKYNHLRQAK